MLGCVHNWETDSSRLLFKLYMRCLLLMLMWHCHNATISDLSRGHCVQPESIQILRGEEQQQLQEHQRPAGHLLKSCVEIAHSRRRIWPLWEYSCFTTYVQHTILVALREMWGCCLGTCGVKVYWKRFRERSSSLLRTRDMIRGCFFAWNPVVMFFTAIWCETWSGVVDHFHFASIALS